MRTWLIILLLCSVASPAVAQTRAEKKQIKVLNEQGITAFQEGRFADAASSFREAWKIHPDPTLRKNEAIAWFKADNCKEASEAGTSFLDSADTDPEARSEINSVLANCRVTYAREAMGFKDFPLAEDFLKQADALATADVTKENIRQARLELAKARSDEQSKQVASTPQEAQASQDSGTRVWPYAVAGTGAAIVLTAVIYHVVSATSTASEYEDVAAAGTDKARYDELASSLDTARWLVPTLYAVGLATTGVGAYFIFGQEDKPTQTTPVSGGVTFSGSF